MLSDERIEKNWNTFLALTKKCGDRVPALQAMLEVIGDRLVLTPGSGKQQYHDSYPGGLVDHSLKVLLKARALNDAYQTNLSSESLIISCLFHDLGKVGDLTEDYYLRQTDEWRREKLGELYTYNEKVQRMPNSERGLWIMQHFGVKLSMDEWLAIRLNDGMYVRENEPYKMHEPTLALIVHQADRMAVQR